MGRAGGAGAPSPARSGCARKHGLWASAAPLLALVSRRGGWIELSGLKGGGERVEGRGAATPLRACCQSRGVLGVSAVPGGALREGPQMQAPHAADGMGAAAGPPAGVGRTGQRQRDEGSGAPEAAAKLLSPRLRPLPAPGAPDADP